MKKVIISGASGYFGTLTKSYLIKSGVEVLSAGRGNDNDIHFDLSMAEEFANKEINNDIDTFIHAAATHEVNCIEQPYNCIFNNVAGTRAALEFCVKNKIKKFIYISTFHVYGTDIGSIRENTQTKPMHDYGLTHLQAEEYVRMYTNKGLIDGVSLRPSNMFDTPLSIKSFNRWSLIPFSFCQSAISESRIELMSPGYQQRNFVSVHDIVKIINKVVSNEIQAEVINIPGVSTYSIKGFAELVKKIISESFGRTIEIVAPDGVKKDNKLDYGSNYFKPEDNGFKHIEEHVREFSRRLINDK